MIQELDLLPQGLELALFWAGRGWPVFPVAYDPEPDPTKRAKRPLVRQWEQKCATDPTAIRGWWAKHPDALVGLATGAPGPDVVDFDVKDGRPGKASWETLIEAGLIDGHMMEVNTPTGGWHRYFVGTDQRNGRVEAAGVDFRGKGGFVMAPGNPGYTVESVPVGEPGTVDWQACRAALAPPTPPAAPSSTPAVPIPTAMPSPATPAKSRLKSPHVDRDWTADQANAEIGRWLEVLKKATTGSINNTLNDVAMRIGHFIPNFIDAYTAADLMMQALTHTEYDGRTWKAADTIESGLRAGSREPYAVRPEPTPIRHTAGPAPMLVPPPGLLAASVPTLGASGTRVVLERVDGPGDEPERVRWLWEPTNGEGRIPLGEITLVAGREGSGKSTFLAWLVAQITKGLLPGEFYGQPRIVIYAAAEDSWRHTITPRLLAAGADRTMVRRVKVQTDETDQARLVLPAHTDAVMRAGADQGAAVLMLDPGLSFLDGRIDTFKAQDLRPALEGLQHAAERAQMSVVMLSHFNKSQGTDVLTKIAGSRAFSEVARAALAIAADRDEDDDSQPEQIVLSQVKNNLGRTHLPDVAFEIRDTVISTKDGDAHVGRLQWVGAARRSAENVLNGVVPRKSGSQSDKPRAGDEIVAWVIQQGRTVSTKEIQEAFSTVDPRTVKMRLTRLIEANKLYRPMSGHYALPPNNDEQGNTDEVLTGPMVTALPRYSVTPEPPPAPPKIRESCYPVTRVTGVTGNTVTHGVSQDLIGVTTRLRSPAAPDESWLVHGDRPTQQIGDDR